MSLFRRERRGATFPEPIIPPFPGYNVFGSQAVTNVDSSLRVSAVWACVRLLADSVSMMPVHAFTMRGGQRVQIPDPTLLRQPSSDANIADWVYMLMVSLLLRGNGYGQIVGRDSAGYPNQIELVNPDLVSIGKEDGQRVYRIGQTTVAGEDMFHVRAFRLPGAPMGLSPISYAARTIQTDGAIADFAYGFFRDGAHPSGILATDQPVNQTQAQTIKERFMGAAKGREPMVLGAGVKYQQIQVAPEESQFLDAQKYGVAQVARIFGVPPEMIAAEAGNSMTYANVEQRSLDFLTYSVQPWLRRLEAAMLPLLPGAKHVRFDTSSLLRTDLDTRVKAGAVAIASKQMTVDEVRQWHDLGPLTDQQKKDLELVPLTVSPSGMPKDAPAGLAPGTAPTQGADDGEGKPAA